MNPLDNLPLNTRKSYVMATTKSGCEVYMPVDTDSNAVMIAAKNTLQEHLDTQPAPPMPEPPPPLRYA